MTERSWLSRRRILALGAAAAVSSLAGGILVYKRTPGELAADIVRRLLPGVRLDEDGLKLFIAEENSYYAHWMRRRLELRFYSLMRPLLAFVPSATPTLTRRIEEWERDRLTRFLVRSDFFYVDPSKKDVTYTGELGPACPNPFLREVVARQG
jgi:hypothetical protein